MAGDGGATRGDTQEKAAGEGASACACDGSEMPTGQPDDRCLGLVPRLLPGDDPRRAHRRDGHERGPPPARNQRPQ